MITRLRQVGDEASVAVLEVILREEVAHVAIGTRWFRHCCAQAGRDPEPTFLALLELIKLKMIKAYQTAAFGVIRIFPAVES